MSDDYSFTWGAEAEGLGFVQVYNFMLRTYASLGITRDEMMCVIHLASYHYNSPNSESRPSLSTIAKEMGYGDSARASDLVRSLESKGLLIITRNPGRASVYDASPFFDALKSRWDQDQKERKRTHALQRKTPMRQGARPPMRQGAYEEYEANKTNQPSSPKNGEDESGLPEPEYVPFDEDGFPSEQKLTDTEPLLRYISESRRNLTPFQSKKLMSGVPFNSPKYPAPSVLFQRDRLFEQFVSEKIKWATGAFDGKRKTTGSLVSAICKYETERFGWLDYKQAHDERRELEAEITYTKPETPPPYQNPEVDPEDLKAFYKELGVGRNGKKLTDEEIEELVNGNAT